MKCILPIFLLVFGCAFGQADSTLSLYNFRISNFDDDLPDDSLTYNLYRGESSAGYQLAHVWRRDTINGGEHKQIYWNPYIETIRFYKSPHDELRAYRYENGRRFTGSISDTLTVQFTPNKIEGYLSGRPYYYSHPLTVIFKAECVDGLMQGRGLLFGLAPQFGIFENIVLSDCTFEDGEIVGLCKEWDLTSVNVNIVDKKIRSIDEPFDYFKFMKLVTVHEITYIKGSANWTKRTSIYPNGRKETFRPEKTRKKNGKRAKKS